MIATYFAYEYNPLSRGYITHDPAPLNGWGETIGDAIATLTLAAGAVIAHRRRARGH